MISAVRFAALLVAGAMVSPMIVAAQKYPEKPVRVLSTSPGLLRNNPFRHLSDICLLALRGRCRKFDNISVSKHPSLAAFVAGALMIAPAFVISLS